MCEVDRVDADRARLDECFLGFAEVVRDGVDRAFGPSDELAQATVRLAVACEPETEAQVVLATGAQRAVPAGRGWIDRNAPAPMAPGLGDATELVTQDERPGQCGVADAPIEQPVSIGTTQPHGGDAHERLALGGLWRRLLVATQDSIGV